MKNIEAVVICYNYSDFLEYTLPHNIQMLDRMVVVTHPSDRETGRLCDKYSVDCIKTEVFHDDNDVFNKGRAINLGLSHLRHNGWVLHIDADVLLPHRFHNGLHLARLDKSCLYGCDRMNTGSFENWEKHKEKLVPQHSWRFAVSAVREFPVGSRLVHLEYGYCPIGFFQLFHSDTKRKYPIVCGSAEHSDVLFATQWPREKRLLLPEFFVTHLESENCKMGANWQGRSTKIFGHDQQKEIGKNQNLNGRKGTNAFDDETPSY